MKTFFALITILITNHAWAGADVHLNQNKKEFVMKAHLIMYGNITQSETALIAKEIQNLWSGKTILGRVHENYSITHDEEQYAFRTEITYEVMSYADALKHSKTNFLPSVNYILIAKGDRGARSYTPELGGNVAVLYQTDRLGESTVASHEFGHLLGIGHADPDWRGRGNPSIMVTDGAWVDPEYQIDPKAARGDPGAKLNVVHRLAHQSDIISIGIWNNTFPNNLWTIGFVSNKLVEPDSPQKE